MIPAGLYRFLGVLSLLGTALPSLADQPVVTFSAPSRVLERYDIYEIVARVTDPGVRNPFTDIEYSGIFQAPDQSPVRVDGFCDAADGSLYRIRFMPSRAGRHTCTVTWKRGQEQFTYRQTFEVRAGRRDGLVRVDPDHPWHFVWEGSGKHYFWNGTTAYFLLGWDDETIRRSIDRLASLKVNRIRVAVTGRVKDGQAWFEHVYPTERFRFTLNPWVAARPDSVENPGFDVTRFNVEHWQKLDRLLRHARDRGVIISVVFYVDGARPGTDPFGQSRMGGPEERLYYRYAAARLASFSNVMWDVTNEYHLFRNDNWANKMGAYLRECDPYDHLTSVHGREDFAFRTSPWADFAMYQSWDEHGGNAFLLRMRDAQKKAGRPIPQVNEEYGYEDHYPQWGGNRKPPARSAENRRLLAWEMVMAGAYQTAGERADQGTGWGPDSGGGWINGRGDDQMILFRGYARMVHFFKGLPWWELEPRNDLAGAQTFCLAHTGHLYIAYRPKGGTISLRLEPGRYVAKWYNPRTGRYTDLGVVDAPQWTSPPTPDEGDWAIVLRRK